MKKYFVLLLFPLFCGSAYSCNTQNPPKPLSGTPSVVVADQSACIGWKFLEYPVSTIRTHMGIDVWANEGVRVGAMAGGVVKDVVSYIADPNFNSLGYMVIIRHPRLGKDNKDLYSMYLHLQSAPEVDVGDYVYRGETIGRVGKTGAANGVPHVHFEIRYFNKRFSDYGNISPKGDVRDQTYVSNNWEDPEEFTVAGQWHGSGSIISYSTGDIECFGCDRDEVRAHENIIDKGMVPEVVFQWQGSERCKWLKVFEPNDDNESENDLVRIFIKPWSLSNDCGAVSGCWSSRRKLPFQTRTHEAPGNGYYNLLRIRFETDQPRERKVTAKCCTDSTDCKNFE